MWRTNRDPRILQDRHTRIRWADPQTQTLNSRSAPNLPHEPGSTHPAGQAHPNPMGTPAKSAQGARAHDRPRRICRTNLDQRTLQDGHTHIRSADPQILDAALNSRSTPNLPHQPGSTHPVGPARPHSMGKPEDCGRGARVERGGQVRSTNRDPRTLQDEHTQIRRSHPRTSNGPRRPELRSAHRLRDVVADRQRLSGAGGEHRFHRGGLGGGDPESVGGLDRDLAGHVGAAVGGVRR